MPRVATPIPESYDSITRPVATEVVRQVCALLSLPSNIQILFPGAAETVPMTGSTLGYEGEPSQFSSDARVQVDVTEELVEQRVLGTAVFQQENPACFVDERLGIRLHPIYSHTEMVIQFTYRAPNRVAARQFRDEALIRSAQMRAENLHEINYSYPIPYEYLHLLQHLHELREAQGGYGEDFSEWVMKCISPRATNLTTLIGTKPLLVIAENQIRPLGWFDFTAQPQPEQKDDNTGPFLVNFEYRLAYDKVVGVAMQYPLVVHNQLIDSKWHGRRRASGDILDPERRRGIGSYSRYAMDRLVDLNVRCHVPEGVRVPEFDDWSPATVHPATVTIATILLGRDPDDPRAVLDLKDLGDYTLEPTVEAFLKTEAPYLNRFTESIVYLSLYRGNVPVEDGSLNIDSNLNVRSNRDLDVRETYRLRIALISDLNLLSTGAFERFRSSGEACLKILSTLQYTLLRDGYLPKLLGGKYVSKSDLYRIADRINDLRRPANGRMHAMQTVGTFFITTHRITDYADHSTQTDGTSREGTSPDSGGGTPLPERDAYC